MRILHQGLINSLVFHCLLSHELFQNNLDFFKCGHVGGWLAQANLETCWPDRWQVGIQSFVKPWLQKKFLCPMIAKAAIKKQILENA